MLYHQIQSTENTAPLENSHLPRRHFLKHIGLTLGSASISRTFNPLPCALAEEPLPTSAPTEGVSLDRESFNRLEGLLKALEKKNIVVLPDGSVQVKQLVAASSVVGDMHVVGDPQKTATITLPSGVLLYNNGQRRVYLAQDQRDYDGDGQANEIGIAEMVFFSPKLNPRTGKALLGTDGRPVLKNSIELEDHVTWRGIKLFDVGTFDTPAGNNPVLELISVDKGQPVPVNMPYLKDGYLNVFARAKSHPMRLVLADSTKGDKTLLELVVDGKNNRLEIGGKVIPLEMIPRKFEQVEENALRLQELSERVKRLEGGRGQNE